MRSALVARRSRVGGDDRARWSAAIEAHLTATAAWSRAEAVAVFVGVGDELDTGPVLRAALAAGKRLWLPRVASATELEFVDVDDLDGLVPARFGLLEPPASMPGVALSQTGVDLVVLPGLAFGTDGSRLGYGRGYYDRAIGGLATPRPTCIGLCYAAFLDPDEGAIPMGEHDRRVDAVVTERGVTHRG
jgi:5-formyltetrahydrofolate cyclo-ligase